MDFQSSGLRFQPIINRLIASGARGAFHTVPNDDGPAVPVNVGDACLRPPRCALFGSWTSWALPGLFEGHANPVLIDPEDSTFEHDAAMFGHKLKPVGDVARILNIDSSPMSGDI